MLMSKTIIFTATLPYEAYKSYKREVDYEYDRYYDEASDEDWGYRTNVHCAERNY